MPSNFPTSFDALSNPNPTDQVASVSHSSQHTNINDIIEAIEAKLGIGVSTPGGSAGVLRRSALNTSMWQQIQAGDYGAGSIVNADVAAAAAIVYSKLVLTGSIAKADLAAGAAMTYLGDTTAGAPTSQIGFVNVPQTYNHLLAVLYTRNNSAGSNVLMRVSTDGTTFDASAIYGYQYLAGVNTTVGTAGVVGQTSTLAGGHGTLADVFDASWVLIPNYTTGSYQKTILVTYSKKDTTAASGMAIHTVGGYYGSTLAIRGLAFLVGVGDFAIGSRITLYGLP